MRAGANEFLQEPIIAATLEPAISRLASTGRFASSHRLKCSRSWAPRAAWARRRRQSTSRPRWPGWRRRGSCSRICVPPTGTRRCSSAPSHASRLSTRCRTRTASTKRSSEAWSRPRKRARRCWLHPNRTAIEHAGTQQFRSVIEFAAQLYRYVVLNRFALGRDTSSMLLRPPRASWWSQTRNCPRSAWSEPARRGAAPNTTGARPRGW